MKTKNWNYQPERLHPLTLIGTVIGGLIMFFIIVYFFAGLSMILN